MARYETYKDSGIEWIGEIPEGWAVTRVKNNASIVAGATPKSGVEEFWDGDIPWIGPADFSDDAHYVSVGRRPITAAGLNSCGTELVPQGSVIVTNRAPIGRIALAANELCTNQGCKSVICREGLHPEYLYWQLACMTEPLQSFGQGTTFIELSTSDLAAFSISQPPFVEQRAIADFLDEKTAEIDEIVSETERSIELLHEYRKSVISEAVTKGLDPDAPMKDSGVEWIGKIPEGWKLVKTLYGLECPITDGPHETPEFFDEGIPFVSAEAVSCGNGRVDFSHMRGYISEEYYNYCCEKYIPRMGDIYMIKSGATTGRVAIVDTDDVFTIWSPLAAIRCDQSKLLPKYAFFYFQSEAFQRQVENGWSYGTQQNIGMRTLEQLLVCYPSLSEQETIADYLDAKTAEIDALIADKEKQVELLKEYRKSLISEAVTGKFKVPGVK